MSNLPPPPPPSGSSPQFPGAGSQTSLMNGALVSPGGRIGAALLDGLLMIVTLWIGWFVWSIVLFKESTSPGKKILKMRIVDANTGAPASMQQMVMREIVGKMVLGWVTGVVTLASLVMLWVAPRRQAVWDYLGTTVVVHD